MIIAIDLDRTLFNCNSVIYKIFNKLEEFKKLNRKLVFKTVQNEKKSNVGFLKFISDAFNPEKYEEIADAIPVIKNWKENGNTILFLSSRPHNIKAIKNSAIQWLQAHDVPYDSLILGCKNKGEFCKLFKVDLLIDDTLNNCISASLSGIPSICLKKAGKPEDKRLENLKTNLFFASSWKMVDLFTSILNHTNPPNNFINQENKFKNLLKDFITETGAFSPKYANIIRPQMPKEIILNNHGKLISIKTDENLKNKNFPTQKK